MSALTVYVAPGPDDEEAQVGRPTIKAGPCVYLDRGVG